MDVNGSKIRRAYKNLGMLLENVRSEVFETDKNAWKDLRIWRKKKKMYVKTVSRGDLGIIVFDLFSGNKACM